jgi:hypothetical protein
VITWKTPVQRRRIEALMGQAVYGAGLKRPLYCRTILGPRIYATGDEKKLLTSLSLELPPQLIGSSQ